MFYNTNYSVIIPFLLSPRQGVTSMAQFLGPFYGSSSHRNTRYYNDII